MSLAINFLRVPRYPEPFWVSKMSKSVRKGEGFRMCNLAAFNEKWQINKVLSPAALFIICGVQIIYASAHINSPYADF